MNYSIFDIETSGVYLIRNKVNNLVYVGASARVNARIADHFRNLRGNRHHSSNLQNAFNEYGEEAFEFILLEETQNLEEREQYWCDHYKANNSQFGYNVRISVNTNKGNKVQISAETRDKISKANSGKIPVNLETIRKMVFKPVALYVDGRCIEIYSNQREAARKTGIHHCTINNQARGFSKSIRGYPNYKFVYI